MDTQNQGRRSFAKFIGGDAMVVQHIHTFPRVTIMVSPFLPSDVLLAKILERFTRQPFCEPISTLILGVDTSDLDLVTDVRPEEVPFC